jgi:hypothetical protein
MTSRNSSATRRPTRFTKRVVAVAALRALVWSALAACLLASIVLLRTGPEFQPSAGHAFTWFRLFWLLCFVPALAMELGAKYLEIELG